MSSIRNILASHHKLMSDIRSILKSMAKVSIEHVDGQMLDRSTLVMVVRLIMHTFRDDSLMYIILSINLSC